MKRKSFVLFCFIIFFVNIFAAENVYADWDIMYSVETFSVDVDNYLIKMTGWSFIDHADNYGGSNLRTYIIAYNADDWSSDIGDDNYKACVKSGGSSSLGCYGIEVTHQDERTLFGSNFNVFASRCTKDGCLEANETYLRTASKRRSTCADSSTLTASGKSKNYSGYGSDCAYFNVGFSVTINLTDIYKLFVQTSDPTSTIKFRILSVVNAGLTIIRSIDLGVSTGVTDNNKTYTFTTPMTFEYTSNNVKTTYKFKKVKIGGVSSNVYITASSASPKQSVTSPSSTNACYGIASKMLYNDLTSNGHSVYFSNTTYSGKLYSGTNNFVCINKDYVDRTYTASYYKVTGTAASGYYVSSGSSKTYYLPSFWGRVSGTLTLPGVSKDEILTDPITGECACEGGACSDTCEYSYPSQKSCNASTSATGCYSQSTKTTSCTETLVDNNSTYEYYYGIPVDTLIEDMSLTNEGLAILYNAITGQSGTYDKNSLTGNTITGVVYNKKVNGNWVSIDTVTIGGVKYYMFPITFYSDISYSQSLGLTLNYTDNTVVDSGRYFQFGLSYSGSAQFSYYSFGSSITSSSHWWYTPYVEVKLKYKKSGGGTAYSSAFELWFNFDSNDKIFYTNGSSWNSVNYSYDSSFYSGNSYSPFSSSETVKTISNNETSSDALSGDLEEMLSISFFDSNDINSSDRYTVNNFSCTSTISGSSVSFNCTYTIPDAYYNPPSQNVYYTSNGGAYTLMNTGVDDSGGSYYYIPFNANTGDTMSILIGGTVSLVDGLKYGYSATCYVKANNEYVNLRYRPIDTSDPFPTASTIDDYPSNWQDYVKKYGLTRITQNSYSAISYQTKLLKNRLTSLDDTYGNYGYYLDMDEYGNSKVVSSTYFNEIRGYHCASGVFDTSCDKVQT